MATKQESYRAFMESVCDKFNCKEALPALTEGFKAFCEAFSPDCFINGEPDCFINGDDANLSDPQEAANVLKQFGFGHLYVYDDATNKAFELKHISKLLKHDCAIHFDSSEEKQLDNYISAY